MTAPRAGTAGDRLGDLVMRAILWGLLKLPYQHRVPLMGRLMAHILAPLLGYHRRAATHLALIYPDLPRRACKRRAKTVCDNFGRTLIENYSWRELSGRLAQTAPQGPGLAAVMAAKERGQPVLFVTGHFGNHEAPRHVLTRMGLMIGGLYRPLSNPYINAHYARTMTDWGGPVFAQGRAGSIGFAKYLMAGGMATLLFDVAVEDGISIPFLGHPARTATSAADLAIKCDALVVPYFGVRAADGLSFDICVEAPITRDTPARMMQDMTKRLEARIAAHPEQWFWVHRRWKQPQ